MAWSSQIFSYAVRAATSVVWHGGAERREGSRARPPRPRPVSFLCAKAQGTHRSGRKLPIAACTRALEFDQYGTLVLVSTPHQTASQPPARLLAFASEFHLGASRRTAPAGVLVAELKNNGEDDHDLAVRDPRGRIIASTGVVRHGALGRLRVRLRPGRYVLVCTLGDHEALGMRTVLVVRARKGAVSWRARHEKRP